MQSESIISIMILQEFALLTLLISPCIILLTYFIKWKLGRQHLYKLAAKIPITKNIPSYPLIGCAPNFIGDNEKYLKLIRQLFNKCVPPQSLWLGHRLFVLISRAEDMEVVFNSSKCLSKDDLYKMVTYLLGEGIFSAPVPKWRRHRKAIMPTFNRRILEEFVQVFSEQAEIFTKQLESKCGGLFDIFEYTNKYAIDTICETIMGVCINAQTTESNIYHHIKTAMDISMIRTKNILYHFDFIYNLTNMSKIARRGKDLYDSFIYDVIERKLMDYRRRVAENEESAMVNEEKKRPAFLEMLIEQMENGENWTTEELEIEVTTFMIAGSDSGASVASFTLLLLGMHPEIQEKCYDEIIEILGMERMLDHTDLPKLVYLEKVIKESMRIFPAGPVILRKVDEDLEVGGHVLPRGAGLVLGIIGIHYSELYYNDPWKFDPERFSPEEIAKRHRYAYLPFAAGPRNCIGKSYSMMSLKTLLAVTLRKYRIETIYKDIREIRLKQAILMEAVNGYPIRLTLRN